MAINISTALRTAMASAADLWNSGVLEIRSGSAPGPNGAAGGTLLASITLPADAFTGPSAGVLTLSGTWEDASADATGTAGHFRIKASDDAGGTDGTDERIEGSITATSGGGDLELDSVSISSAQAVSITSFTITMPGS